MEGTEGLWGLEGLVLTRTKKAPMFYLLLEGLVDEKSHPAEEGTLGTFRGGKRNRGLLEQLCMWSCVCGVMKEVQVLTMRLPDTENQI